MSKKKENYYKVFWEEKRSVKIKAKTKNEAINKISIGDYKDSQETAEITLSPEAKRLEN